MTTFDVGIIGAGMAGSFAVLRLSEKFKNLKTIVFDVGRPPQKRRRQLDGWLGCLPNSDGKLYQNDIVNVAGVIGIKKTNYCNKYLNSILSEINTFKIVKDKSPSAKVVKSLEKNNFNFLLNDYMQMYPKDIHSLSKHMVELLEENKNAVFSFDNEVYSIHKSNGLFEISTEQGDFKCKKLLIAVGRSGWRWAKDVYDKFGIIDSNDIARFGIRVEAPSNNFKEYNKSHCTLYKDNLCVGPLSWSGTVIPEDHINLAISAFRSNENRWKTDKVSFSLIGDLKYPDNGCEQTDRVGQLTFILANDRIMKEKISTLLSKKSKISIMPEYNWLAEAIENVREVMPNIEKSYFHIPTIMPLVPKINIGTNLETEVDNMFVAGESAGLTGLLSAALTGIAAADNMCK